MTLGLGLPDSSRSDGAFLTGDAALFPVHPVGTHGLLASAGPITGATNFDYRARISWYGNGANFPFAIHNCLLGEIYKTQYCSPHKLLSTKLCTGWWFFSERLFLGWLNKWQCSNYTISSVFIRWAFYRRNVRPISHGSFISSFITEDTDYLLCVPRLRFGQCLCKFSPVFV